MVSTKVDTMEARIAKFECAGTSSEPEQAPALIIGGWYQDSETSKVIEQANKLASELRLDLDMRDTFESGLRRGYAIVHYAAKKRKRSPSSANEYNIISSIYITPI